MTYQQSIIDALRAALPHLEWSAISDLAISGHARGVVVGIQWERPDLSGYRLEFAAIARPRDVRPVMVVSMAAVGVDEQCTHYDRHLEPEHVAQAVREIVQRITQWAEGAATAAGLAAEAIRP